MNKYKCIFILFILFSLHSQAQTINAKMGTVKDAYNFWIYNPGGDEELKPLIVFLHGASLSGSNLDRVRRYGPLHAIEMGLNLDAYVLAPQTRNGWNPEKVWKLVEWTEKNYNVDTNRIYVIGMSMGGYGTINVCATYYDKIAAGMALCGGGNMREYCGINQMPMWIMHGTADRAVPISQSEKVVNAMKNCGDTNRLIFTRLKGKNHGDLARIFYLKETYEWLLSHRLDDPDRKVRRDIKINEQSLPHAYDGIRSDKAAGKSAKVSIVRSNGNGGEETTVTEKATTSKDNGGKQYYKVKSGDNLGKIAKKHHTTVKKLCQLNGIKETTTLQIGKRLRVH